MEEMKDKLEKIIKEAAEYFGYEIIKWRYKEGKKGLLQIYIDKPEGIKLNDCIRFNKYLSNILDEKDPIPESYVIEISSPGVVRPLESNEDYEKAKNKWVVVTTKESIEGRREFSGELKEMDKDSITLYEKGKLQKILKKHILKARIDTPIYRKK